MRRGVGLGPGSRGAGEEIRRDEGAEVDVCGLVRVRLADIEEESVVKV